MQPQPYLPFTTHELFGNRWQYLLLVSPDYPVTAKVREEKDRFYSLYRLKMAIKTLPHITVARFTANEDLEKPLVALMQSVCKKHQRFFVELLGFDGFEAHAIFIKVREHKPFHELAHGLDIINNYLIANEHSAACLVTEPHMTIAREISCRVYTKAIDSYLRRSFSGSFWVHELLLFKRRHRGETYQRVTSLRLPSWSGYPVS